VNKEINKTVIIAGRVKRKASQLSSSLHSSARRNSAFQCIFNINKHFSFCFFEKLDWFKITSHTSTWENQTGVLKAANNLPWEGKLHPVNEFL